MAWYIFLYANSVLIAFTSTSDHSSRRVLRLFFNVRRFISFSRGIRCRVSFGQLFLSLIFIRTSCWLTRCTEAGDVMRSLSGACVHIWKSERSPLHRFQCRKQRQYKLVFRQSSDFFPLDRLRYQSTRSFQPQRSFRPALLYCYTFKHVWQWWRVACCKQWTMRLGKTISCTEHFVQQT